MYGIYRRIDPKYADLIFEGCEEKVTHALYRFVTQYHESHVAYAFLTGVKIQNPSATTKQLDSNRDFTDLADWISVPNSNMPYILLPTQTPEEHEVNDLLDIPF